MLELNLLERTERGREIGTEIDERDKKREKAMCFLMNEEKRGRE